MKKVAPVVACGVGAGIILMSPDIAATDALTAMTITIAVVIVLAVMGLLIALILRVNRERNSYRVRELPPVKVIRVTAEQVSNPHKSIKKAPLHLGAGEQ